MKGSERMSVREESKEDKEIEKKKKRKTCRRKKGEGEKKEGRFREDIKIKIAKRRVLER